MDQRRFDNPPSEFVDAREAARMLGVKLATLYSYAARGKIHSIPSGRKHQHLYRRGDVERVKALAAARSGHGPVAAGALQWGEPVLESVVSGIDARGPVYRGHLAVDLARDGVRFERAAELLWGDGLPEESQWERPRELGAPVRLVQQLLAGQERRPLSILLVAAPILAVREAGPPMHHPEAERKRARTAIWRMAAWLGLVHSAGRCREALKARSIADALAVSLGAQHREKAATLLDRALVLLADHELNASSFAARVAASAHGDLLACLVAALATFSGPRHGAECDRVDALADEVGVPRQAAKVLSARAARGDALPGFGHRLYPGGDPRAGALWEAALEFSPRPARLRTLLAIAQAVETSTGLRPAVDFALVALCAALGLAPGSATGVFAVGRAAGWVAHVLEQRQSPALLRPRARYVGPVVP